MSTLETILTRAMSDPAFADQLFADAEGAAAGYDLTAEEFAALKSMSRLEFDTLSAASPEERKSFASQFNFIRGWPRKISGPYH